MISPRPMPSQLSLPTHYADAFLPAMQRSVHSEDILWRRNRVSRGIAPPETTPDRPPVLVQYDDPHPRTLSVLLPPQHRPQAPYPPSNSMSQSLTRLPAANREKRPVRSPSATVTATGTARSSLHSAAISEHDGPTHSGKQAEPGANRRLGRRCVVSGCSNYNIAHGRCFRHGGGKTCLVVDCKRSAKARGLCWRHGGSVICTIEGCTRGAKSRGLCWSHGGGTKCSEPTCDKTMISKGLCWTHGGGKRCLLDGCKRPASEKRQNFCPKHHAQVSQRGYVSRFKIISMVKNHYVCVNATSFFLTVKAQITMTQLTTPWRHFQYNLPPVDVDILRVNTILL